MKSNSNLSIGGESFFLEKRWSREVVKPVGKVNALIQKQAGVPSLVHFRKKSYRFFKSSFQLDRGFVLK